MRMFFPEEEPTDSQFRIKKGYDVLINLKKLKGSLITEYKVFDKILECDMNR